MVLVILACALYMLVNVKFGNEKLFWYAMKIRTPKLIVMLITAFAIGGASIVFQSIINNTIVTPCLLGMNSLYMVIHTAVVFVAGSGSVLAVNPNAAFAVDLVLMGGTATVIYSYLFKKTNHNVLYVLLIGTVLTSFFGSIQSTLTRVMDPNEYDSLLATLVASFSNVNSEIIVFSVIVMGLVVFCLRKELALLDVITLGKEQAINLGVDYDRCIRRLLLGVTLFIAVATAMVGPISFLGLIIANLSRQLLQTYRHSHLILGSAFFGMVILVAGQLLVEQIYSYTVPVSVFITVFGGIYFLYLLQTYDQAVLFDFQIPTGNNFLFQISQILFYLFRKLFFLFRLYFQFTDFCLKKLKISAVLINPCIKIIYFLFPEICFCFFFLCTVCCLIFFLFFFKNNFLFFLTILQCNTVCFQFFNLF